MERSVGHALVVVEHARVKQGVNQPVMPPHADNQGYDERDNQCADNDCKVESVFQHVSPHVVQHASQHATVSDQQEGAEGYAVKQHLRLRVVWQGLL